MASYRRNTHKPNQCLSDLACPSMLGGLEFAGEEEQPLRIRVMLGRIWYGASCPNLYTLAALEGASEAEQPLEFQVLLGLVRYQLG